MKILATMSAGLVVIAVPATAQMDTHRDSHTTVTTTRTVQHDGDMDHHDMDRHDRRMDRHHVRRVCKWQWRHHHKVRICRTTRW